MPLETAVVDIVADRAVLHLAARLRKAELVDTAELLEGAYDREARIVALDIPDREAILRVLEECPEEMLGTKEWAAYEGWPPSRRDDGRSRARNDYLRTA